MPHADKALALLKLHAGSKGKDPLKTCSRHLFDTWLRKAYEIRELKPGAGRMKRRCFIRISSPMPRR